MIKVLMSLLFGSFLLTASSFAQTPPPAAPPVAAPTAVAPMHHEHHPEIHKAMRKLRGAKADLEKAAHDYAGHRVAAIKLIDQALEELRAALESDKS
jgi:hypothetical protein